MPRINVTNPEAFAKQYPHLVRTVIVPDTRKITSAIKDGWKLEHTEVVEGTDEEAPPVAHEKQGTEAERPAPVPAPAAAPAPDQAGKPTERTLGEVMGILQNTPAPGQPAIPPSFPRWAGESERDYHERYNLTERLRAHEERAKMNKSPA